MGVLVLIILGMAFLIVYCGLWGLVAYQERVGEELMRRWDKAKAYGLKLEQERVEQEEKQRRERQERDDKQRLDNWAKIANSAWLPTSFEDKDLVLSIARSAIKAGVSRDVVEARLRVMKVDLSMLTGPGYCAIDRACRA